MSPSSIQATALIDDMKVPAKSENIDMLQSVLAEAVALDCLMRPYWRTHQRGKTRQPVDSAPL